MNKIINILRPHLIVIKMFIAIIMLSGVICVASLDMAPDVPLAYILIACGIAVPIFLIILIYGIIGGASFNQSTMRRGGIDTSWLWFNSDPPGFEKPKDELKESEDTK